MADINPKKILGFFVDFFSSEATLLFLMSVKKEEKKSNRSINKKLDFGGPVSHLRESTISDLESPSNFQVKEKKILKSVKKQ